MAARLFLVAPKGLPLADVLASAKAACAAGDCASIVIHENAAREDVEQLQDMGLAVLLADVEPRIVSHLKADGLHLNGTEHNLLDLRMSLPRDALIGLDCGTSRHAAMEAAEQGADYVGFRQKAQTTGEPLVKWWTALAAIPAVPLDAVEGEAAMILSQEADFIRPTDAMWENPAAATRVISEIGKK